MRFVAESGSGHHVTLDADEHGGGQNAGFRPMELYHMEKQLFNRAYWYIVPQGLV